MIVDKHEALYKDVSSLEVVAYTTRGGDFEDGVTFILEKLDVIPVADVQPVRHGKWIEPDYVYFGAKCYICDQCKEDEYWIERFHNHKENYCPNCGADMRGDN